MQKSPPDGYNLLLAGGSTWIFPLLVEAPYDVVNDFSPVSLLVREAQVLVVHPSLPVNLVHIPYQGGIPSVTAVISGKAQM